MLRGVILDMFVITSCERERMAPRSCCWQLTSCAAMAHDDANAMDEIIPGLWIGNLRAATDEQLLRDNNIHSVLSAMRGRVRVHEVCLYLYLTLVIVYNQCMLFLSCRRPLRTSRSSSTIPPMPMPLLSFLNASTLSKAK